MERSMKVIVSLLCIVLTACFAPLRASDTFTDYQNYNHGYCPDCNCHPCKCNSQAETVGAPACASVAAPPACAPATPAPCAPVTPAPCAPCKAPCEKPEPCAPAPVCATNCGISLCWIGLGLAVVATAAAIIVSSNNGRSAH